MTDFCRPAAAGATYFIPDTNPIERTFRELRRRTKVMDNVTPNADSINRIFREIAEAMNRSWWGTTLQAIFNNR